MSHFLVLDDGGSVVFCQSFGGPPRPPLPTLALLGALSRYSEDISLNLEGMETKDTRTVFHRYCGSDIGNVQY